MHRKYVWLTIFLAFEELVNCEKKGSSTGCFSFRSHHFLPSPLPLQYTHLYILPLRARNTHNTVQFFIYSITTSHESA